VITEAEAIKRRLTQLTIWRVPSWPIVTGQGIMRLGLSGGESATGPTGENPGDVGVHQADVVLVGEDQNGPGGVRPDALQRELYPAVLPIVRFRP